MELVHISKIKVGDTINHNGEVLTISGNNIKNCSFMGKSIFGDTYSLGYKKVQRLTKKNLQELNK